MRRFLLGVISALALVAGTAVALAATTPFTYTITVPGGTGGGSTCPEDDGASGATAGSPNFPTVLGAYQTARTIHAIGCKVAGVDYHVGAPDGVTRKAPTATNLPPGCSLGGSTVSCLKVNGLVFSGYEMSGKKLDVSGANVTITGNNWSVSSNCLAPITFAPSGTWHIEGNSFDGSGNTTCGGGMANGLNAMIYNAGGTAGGSVVFLRWNLISHIPEDGINFGGPSSGSLSVHVDNNVFYGEGWTGHPDGIQLTRGNFTNSTTNHNTYIKNAASGGPDAGTQPLHVEAQLGSAVSGWTVAFNTMVTPGSCNGGRNWPSGCVFNYDIACKNDTSSSESDSNTGFRVYANYFDWSGGIRPMATTSYHCTSTSVGTPLPNIDMLTGGSLSGD